MGTSSSVEHVGFRPEIEINSLIPRLRADIQRRQIEKWGSPTGTAPHKCDPRFCSRSCAKPWDTLREIEERKVALRHIVIYGGSHDSWLRQAQAAFSQGDYGYIIHRPVIGDDDDGEID